MSVIVSFKDKDGFRYKHPERSCKHCTKNPCLPKMNLLFGDFAAYGCTMYEDDNTFEV